MTSAIVALRGEYLDTRTFRYCRNQRDAGIEHLEWEDRIKPQRPLFHDALICMGALMLATSAFFLV
jgi:hypothetical protein